MNPQKEGDLMLPKKKRKLFVLYSIPIHQTLYNRKYLVSYSIPLASMVALLLLGLLIVNPSNALKTNAVTIQDEWVVTDNPEAQAQPQSQSKEENDNSEDSVDEEFGGFGEDDMNSSSDTSLSQSDQDAGISLMSIVTAPTLGITVSNSNQTIQAVQGGNTVYGSYNVSITGSNVKDYTLSIKADSVNLVSPSQASTPTTITGAGGKTGSNLTANTWGYKLTETSTAESSYGTLAYANLPTTLTQIANGNVASPYNLSANKKLVFAAKFAETAAPGTYSGHITLSAVANQAVVSAIWSSGLDSTITDMQDIGDVSGGFCKSTIPAGSTITLRDSRGGVENFYKVTKMQDGTCWMTENLRLKGGTKITSTDSDVKSDWTLPANASTNSTTMNWGTDNNTAYMAEGSTSMKIYNNGGAWKEAYGNYYSWCAATAMSCKLNRTGAALNNDDAAESICPKGWKLPAHSGAQSFQNLYSQYPNSTTAGWMTNQTISYNGSTSTGYNGIKLGYNNVSAFFPAAGNVSSDGLNYASSNGRYWSRRAYSYTTYAYYLSFYSSGVSPQNNYDRYFGYSVRCVAQY